MKIYLVLVLFLASCPLVAQVPYSRKPQLLSERGNRLEELPGRHTPAMSFQPGRRNIQRTGPVIAEGFLMPIVKPEPHRDSVMVTKLTPVESMPNSMRKD